MRNNDALTESSWVRVTLTSVALVFLALFSACRCWWFSPKPATRVASWVAAISEPDALAALRLSLTVAPSPCDERRLRAVRGVGDRQVPLPRRNLLTSFIDLPFSVSRSSRLVYVLLSAPRIFGTWLQDESHPHPLQPAGLVLATTFVTFPFVARELIP